MANATVETKKASKKDSANGVAPPPDPKASAAPTPPPEPTAEERAKIESDAKERGFRRFLGTFTSERLIALCEHDAGMRKYFEALQVKAESAANELRARLADLQKEAASMGVELPGMGTAKPRKPGTAKPRKPGGGGAPPVDPAIVAKVMADLKANPESLGKDIIARTGIDAATFGRIRDEQGESIRKTGTRGPHVKYSAA